MKLMSEYLLIFMGLCGVAEASEQTLDVFLESAATLALDDREARATLAQREGEAMQSWGRLLPSFSVAGDYTRNQQAVTFELPDGTMGETRTITISARDQFDLTLSASVPLIDAQTWLRTAAQVASSDAARQRLSATALETERQVVRAYYVLVAAEALVHSTRVALSAQEATAALTTERKEAGLAGELDTRRAAAEVAVARQNVSDALYSLAAARRTLRTLTGVTPNDQPHVANDAIAGTESRAPPSTVAAKLDVTVAKRNEAAAWLALAPTLSVKANERLTNAPGFSPNPFWSVVVSARFTLDAVSFGNVRVQAALAEQAVVRAERAQSAARDQLEDAQALVESSVAKVSATKARAEETKLSASLARDRMREGKATQLEVIQADRDSLDAEVSAIRANADLHYARALVLLCEGRSLRKRGKS